MEYGISNEALQVTISELGGELMSVTRPDGTEYIWQGDPTFWKKRAPYLCIEPWTALPARQDVVEELSQQPDILRLEPGQRYENKWEIIFG